MRYLTVRLVVLAGIPQDHTGYWFYVKKAKKGLF